MGFFTGSDAVGFVGNVANFVSNGLNSKKNREWMHNEQELAYQRNLEQWYRESAYNSPVNQMKLLKEAGLNPNLAYDQSTTPAGSPTMQAPQYSNPAPQVDVNSLLQSHLLKAQIDNINADTGLKESGTNLNTANTNKAVNESRFINQQAQLVSAQTRDIIARWDARSKIPDFYLNQAKSEFEESAARLHIAKLDKYDASLGLQWIYSHPFSTREATTEQMRAQTDLFRDMIRSNKSQRNLNNAQIREINARIENMVNQNQVLRSLSNLYQEQARTQIYEQGYLGSKTTLNNTLDGYWQDANTREAIKLFFQGANTVNSFLFPSKNLFGFK